MTITNDNFTNRSVLTENSVTATGTNIGATGEVGEPDHAGFSDILNSVWWSWTATANGAVTINTNGSDFDTTLGVYTGSSVSSLTTIASDDDSGQNGASVVTFSVISGTTYQIAVDGFNEQTGNINLALDFIFPPINDNFANRSILTGSIVTATGTNIGATGETQEPLHTNISGYVNSVWWSWVASINGPVTVNTNGSNFDTTLAVYTGSSVSSLTPIASDDDGGEGNASLVTFSAISGTTYQIAVDGYQNKIGNINLYLDSNQSPTDLTLSNSNINENLTTSTIIGDFTTTDPNPENIFTYSLVTGVGSTDNNLFTITNNQLKTNAVFDFETKNSYSIRVKTTDQGGLFLEKALTITVNDVNDPPTTLTLSNSGIAENQPINTVIGNFTTTDPDTGNTFTYSLVLGTGSTDNSLFTIQNNQLKTNTVFDFETKNSYSIRVKTTDQGGLSFEQTLTINITDVSDIISLESNGNLKMVKDIVTNYLYSQTGNNAPIAIKYNNQPIYQNIFAGWQTIAVESINGQTQVLWKTTDNASIVVWQLDNNGNYQSSEGILNINSLQGLTQETLFQIDLNGDGKLGNVYSDLETNGNTKLVKDSLNYLYSQTGNNAPIAIKYNNQPIYQNNFPGWQTIAVESINGQTQVLWKTTDNASIQIWQLDNNGNYQSYEGTFNINSYQTLTQENLFQIDLNGDGKLGNNYSDLETNGNTKLVKDSLNYLYSQIGNNVPIAIKYNNQPIYQNIFPGWQPIAVEGINGQNKVLWKTTDNASIQIWQLDNNGNYQGYEGTFNINSYQTLTQENLFQIDLNGDGKLGNIYSNLETNGNTKLVKDSLNYLYSQTGNNAPIAIKYNNQPIYQNNFSGWQTIAVESINGQTQVLWKTTDNASILIWKLDNNGNYQGYEGIFNINSYQTLTQENFFQIDLNGDGKLGNIYSDLETNGNTKLVKDSLNYLYSQTGNNAPIAIKYNKQPIYQNNFSGWQTIAVENINGQTQVLWKTTDNASILIWKLDNNENYQSYEGTFNINSTQTSSLEEQFQFDINSDNLLTATQNTILPSAFNNLTLITGNTNINGTGNEKNNTIIGNAGNNQINGGAGADILTGNEGVDTFIFQFGQSLVSATDRITDFAIGTDKIDLLTQGGSAMNAPTKFTRAANSTATSLQNLATEVFNDADGATTGNQALDVNSAALVQVTTGSISGTYLIINDSNTGFQSSNDLLVNLTGYTGILPDFSNINMSSFFV